MKQEHPMTPGVLVSRVPGGAHPLYPTLVDVVQPAPRVSDQVAGVTSADPVMNAAAPQAEQVVEDERAELVALRAEKARGFIPEGLWHKGCPPHPYGSEWFIAKLDNGERVVLKELYEEHSYDYRTADETYYSAFRIAHWMQFQDSQYTTPPTPDVSVMQAELDRLNQIINSPQSDDFLRAVSTEAEHQRQRWGSDQDQGKTPADWFWLVGYLAGKALHAHIAGNMEKAEHHVITTAAALANWRTGI